MRRLATGGRIDRSRPLSFTWNGERLRGFAGDTLASALLGAGVDVLGTSVALGRPRGIMSAGLEEATGFAQVWSGNVAEPLVRTTALPLYEGLRAEGRIVRGMLHDVADEGRFDKRFAHCDVLVIGAGRTGIAAALAASRDGARVILVDADVELGGALLRDDAMVDETPAMAWVREARTALEAAPETLVLTSTIALMMLDQNGVLLVQRVGALLPESERGALPEQRVWQVRARDIVMATGTLERPLVFPDNDRPGIMLAGAAHSYLVRHALAPTRALVFTNNDVAYRTAFAWRAAGVDVAGIVDVRTVVPPSLRERVEALGIPLWVPSGVIATSADAAGRLAGVTVRDASGDHHVACDLLAVSGGHDANVALQSQLRGATVQLSPDDAMRVVAPDGDESRSFVDLHRDATVAGVERAVGAGVRHIEHVKRFTLVGTGVEQGRTARTNAGLLTASLIGEPAASVGISRSRPPVEPIPFALMAGRATGERYEPRRTTSIHAEHVAMGAVLEVAGQWMRPSRYPRAGEDARATIARECRAARERVAIVDVSTLGKIDVRGPDAAWFLDQLYVNAIGNLRVGQARYSVMCQLDGAILDDGVVMRLAPQHFFVTTSTSHAATVVDWMEEWLQTEWPTRRVWVTPITEQFATVAIVGPRARDVLARVAPALDVSREAFPFHTVRRGVSVAAIADAQVARVSFSGELSYEVSVRWHEGAALWRALLEAGAAYDIMPYGLDAMQQLRMEKGFVIVGQDTEALTTVYDAGLGWLVDESKEWVGKRSTRRAGNRRSNRAELVGFVVVGSDEVIPEGAALTRSMGAPPRPIDGHVSTSGWSDPLGMSLGLALVRGGRARIGEELVAPLLDGRVMRVRLVSPAHYDPKGARRDG